MSGSEPGNRRIAAQNTLQIIVRLWIHPARVAEFEAYERKVAPIMRRHGGGIEKVIRVSAHEPAGEEPPFEIHLLAFPSLDAFLAYRADSELAGLAAERSSVILRTEITFGSTGPEY